MHIHVYVRTPKRLKHFFLHPWQLCHSTIITSLFSPLLLRISTCLATSTSPLSCPVCCHSCRLLVHIQPVPTDGILLHTPLLPFIEPKHPCWASSHIATPPLALYTSDIISVPLWGFPLSILLTCQGLHRGFVFQCSMLFSHVYVFILLFMHSLKCSFLKSNDLGDLSHFYMQGCLLAYTKHPFDIFKIKKGWVCPDSLAWIQS